MRCTRSLGRAFHARNLLASRAIAKPARSLSRSDRASASRMSDRSISATAWVNLGIIRQEPLDIETLPNVGRGGSDRSRH